MPGGHVENGETFMEAVIREVKEETGIDIEIIRFCGVSQEVSRNCCNMWWLGTPIGGEIQTSSESLDVNYFNLEEALNLIENDDFIEELNMCLDTNKHPFLLTFN